MPTDTASVIGNGSDLFQTYLWASNGNTVRQLGANVSSITLIDLSTNPYSVFIDRYRSDGAYQANVRHTTVAAAPGLVLPWQPNDINWAGLGLNGDRGISGFHEISASWTNTAPPPCAYGTRLRDPAAATIYLTSALLDTWLLNDGMPYLAALFTSFWGTYLNAQHLCSTGPPPMPVIDLSTLQASAVTLAQVLDVIAWPNICECIPGSPAPTPIPPPVIVPNPGFPPNPTFPCDPAALCGAIEEIRVAVAAIQRTVGIDLGLTTLLQRYQIPFSYIKGAVHSGLQGTGSFTVPRLIGLGLDVEKLTDSRPILPGVPPYMWDQGWVSVQDGNGFIDERRLTRTHQIWLPKIMEEVTEVGWSLFPGTQLAITELEAEP